MVRYRFSSQVSDGFYYSRAFYFCHDFLHQWHYFRWNSPSKAGKQTPALFEITMAALMHPARFFLMIGGVFGLILVFLIPPMGGGNEEFNFQRAVSIAYGGFFIKPVQTPQGINELIRESSDFFHEGLKAPFAYNRDDFTRANSIEYINELRCAQKIQR